MRLLSLLSIGVIGIASGRAISSGAGGDCPDGVHIIAARGNGTTEGYGIMLPMVESIKEAIPNSGNISVTYPKGVPANEGNTVGTENYKQLISDFVDKCPNTPVVLVGYSEGAGLTMNTVCGTTNPGFASTPALEKQYHDNIIAVVVYGDYTYVSSESWDVGTCESDSPWPRGDPSTCDPLAAKIHSWCNAADPVCCSTGTDPTAHHDYFNEYDEAMAGWVASQFSNHQRRRMT